MESAAVRDQTGADLAFQRKEDTKSGLGAVIKCDVDTIHRVVFRSLAGSNDMVSLIPISRLAAGWAGRLRELQTALQQDPTNARVWRWRIELKVLSFLISRYGRISNLVDPSLRAPHDVAELTPPRLVRRQTIESHLTTSVVRAKLAHIAEQNQFKLKSGDCPECSGRSWI